MGQYAVFQCKNTILDEVPVPDGRVQLEVGVPFLTEYLQLGETTNSTVYGPAPLQSYLLMNRQNFRRTSK